MSKNLSTSTIETVNSTTSITVEASTGTRFDATPFPAVLHPPTEVPTPDNAEIVTVTNVSTDIFTIVRHQRQTTQKAIAQGWRITAGLFAEEFDAKISKGSIFLNVKDFGAIGDGVANDYVAIQAALDAVPTSGTTPSIVYFPAGTYKTGTRFIPKSNTTIKGESKELVTITNTLTSGGVFANLFTTTLNNVRFENIGFLGGVQNDVTVPTRARTRSANADNAIRFRVQDANSINPASDVNVAANTITLTAHPFATGSYIIYRATNESIAPLLHQAKYYVIKVDANTIKLAATLSDAQAGTAIDLTYTGNGSHNFAQANLVSNIQIVNCKFRRVNSLPILMQWVDNVVVEGCYFENNLDVGFTFCNKLLFTKNNIVMSSDNGVSISRGCEGVVCSNNIISDSCYNGIWVTGFNDVLAGVAWTGPKDVTVTGNVVNNSGDGGIRLAEAPKRVTVTGNTINGTLRGPVDEPGDTRGAGIVIAGFPADSNTPTDFALDINIAGNIIINCSRGGIRYRSVIGLGIHGNTIINPGTRYLSDGSTEIAYTDNSQNYGIAVETSQTVKSVDISSNTLIDRRGPDATFEAAAVNITTDVINIPSHPFSTGDKVYYQTNSNAIGGLNGNGIYYVIKVDANNVQLAQGITNAINGVAINLTGPGTSTHRLILILANTISSNQNYGNFALVNGSYATLNDIIVRNNKAYGFRNYDTDGDNVGVFVNKLSGSSRDLIQLQTSNTDKFRVSASGSVYYFGAVTNAYRTSSTDDPVIADQYIGVDTSSGPRTYTLPTPSGVNGRVYTIFDITGNASTNNITVTCSAALINGSSSYVMAKNGVCSQFLSVTLPDTTQAWYALDLFAAPTGTYSVSNVTPDRTFNATSTTTAEVAQVLGTLISDLKIRGIIG